MKRSDALAQLSRDHHDGLVVAQRLNRATETTAVAARDTFLTFWETEGRDHFRVEEDILLPAFARHHAPTDDAVTRVLIEHADLRAAPPTWPPTPARSPKRCRHSVTAFTRTSATKNASSFHASRPHSRRTNSSNSPQPSRS